MAFIGKIYKLDRDDNFDGFVQSLDLPADRAEVLKKLKPSHQLKKNGDTYSLLSNDTEVTFQSGVEFVENVGGFKDANSTITVDGDTVTQVQKFDDEKIITFKREYSGNNLVVTITSNFWDGTATRYYTAA